LNSVEWLLSSFSDQETNGQNVPVLPALGLRLADEDLQKAQFSRLWGGSSIEKYPTSHEHFLKPMFVDDYYGVVITIQSIGDYHSP